MIIESSWLDDKERNYCKWSPKILAVTFTEMSHKKGNDIKSTLQTLCRHLNILLNIEIKPEIFRLAKFDQSDDDVVPVLWSVLNRFSKKNSINLTYNVKNYMLSLKYDSTDFYALPEDMSRGSRELLIAIAFLIASGELTKLYIDTITNSPFDSNYHFPVMAHESSTFDLSPNPKSISNKSDYNNYVKWIQGKTALNKKLAQDYKDCTKKLLYKINKGSSTSLQQNDDISLAHVMALNNEKYAATFLSNTEHVIKVLENHERWLQKENLFWEWMKTVLMEKQKEKTIPNLENLHMFFNELNVSR